MTVPNSAENRLEGLSQILVDSKIDAYLSFTAVNMGYLAGLHEEGGERLLFLALHSSGQVAMIAPALAKTQAEKSGLNDIRTWIDGEDPYQLAHGLFSEWNVKRVAVDDETRASILLALQNSNANVKFLPGQEAISRLMRNKSAGELDCLREAGRIADLALANVKSKFKPGQTEWHINEVLSQEMQSLGGRPQFCIIATGQNSAEPHHMTDQSEVKQGDVAVIDYGCVYKDYMSDVTRTFCFGTPTSQQSKVYQTVYDAHMAARQAIRPGVTAESVDKAARDVIDAAGYGEFFVHRTGHGLGRRVHEEPYICKGNSFELEEGNVFSIEPGIYLPGQFGVRIENIVAVTADGHESLNGEPSPHMEVLSA
ncbi:MAG: aminopeptidase P family protein [Chthonomonadaceae bacterium]|nr:aminopeptidase P family protein [Chthonomonadaceae bacterium]